MEARLPNAINTGDLANTLYTLRTGGQSNPTANFVLPSNLAEAMEVQHALARLEGAGDTAWKVAMSPDQHAVMARLYPYVETELEAQLPYLPGMKFELELALRLGRDLPARTEPYSRTEIVEAVSHVHIGAELLSSAVTDAGKVSFPLYVADRIGNRGYALGPVVAKVLLDTIEGTETYITHDGVPLFSQPAKHPAGDPLAWLLAYANDPYSSNNILRAGTVITTGALTGAMLLPGPGRVEVRLAQDYAINVTLTAPS
jgi:2-keto-4-pentenoate hydratase